MHDVSNDHDTVVGKIMRTFEAEVVEVRSMTFQKLDDDRLAVLRARGPYASVAPLWHNAGWPVLPLPYAKKKTPPNGFTGDDGKDPTRQQVAEWCMNGFANVCVRMPSTIVALDLDLYKDGAREKYEALVVKLGPLPPTFRMSARDDDDSGAYLYTVDDGDRFVTKFACGEVLQRHHRYMVTAPSVHPRDKDPKPPEGAVYICYAPDGSDVTFTPPKVGEVVRMPQAWRAYLLEGACDDPGHQEPPSAPRPKHERTGNRSPAVQRAYFEHSAQLHSGEARHDAACAAAQALVRLEERGHEGASEALDLFGATFRAMISAPGDRATPMEAEKEWSDLVESAWKKVHSTPATTPTVDEMEAERERNDRELRAWIDGTNTNEEHTSDTHGVQFDDDIGKPGDYFIEKAFVPMRAARSIMRQTAPVRHGIDGRLWRYDGGVYRPDGEEFARFQTVRRLGESYRPGHGDAVVGVFRSMMLTIGNDEPVGIINVRNGLLDLATGELRPHDPNVLSTVQLPVRWDPAARCPLFEKFLHEVLPLDVEPFVFEWFGFCLHDDYRLHSALLALGSGANGKTTFFDVLVAMLGQANVSCVSLHDIGGEDRFALAQLHGKLANVCDDIGAHDVKRSDDFKKLTGGRIAVSGQHKFKPRFDFVNRAKLNFSANEAPLTSDQSDAWFRRWHILEFVRTFAENERDAELPRKLTSADELEGILVRAVDGLRALLARGRFEVPPSMARAAEAYRERLDSLLAFVDDSGLVFDRGDSVLRSELYKRYVEWCAESGSARMSSRTFLARFRKNYADRIEEVKLANGWHVKGVRFERPPRPEWF